MQRLHEEDWTGHALGTGAWAHLVIPQEFEPRRRCECASCKNYNDAGIDEIGWCDPRANEGELLFPKRFPPEELDSERLRLGSMGYAGQHQQSPTPAKGALFNTDWFDNRYRHVPKYKEVYCVLDTALKAAQENDESVFGTFGITDDGFCDILGFWYGREETPKLQARVTEGAKRCVRLFGSAFKGVYVEDKVSGTTLLQYIRNANPSLAFIPIRADTDKVSRANGVTPICEARRIRFPDPAIFPATVRWVSDLISQLALFPRGAHDDRVDVFVYGVKRFLGTLKIQGARKARKSRTGGYA
jgi:predicted phage terminase large subunit-like protein